MLYSCYPPVNLVTLFLFFPFMLIKNVTCFSRYLCCPVRVGVARLIYTPYNPFILPVYWLFCHFGLISRFDFFRRCKVSCYKSRSPVASLIAAIFSASIPQYMYVVRISSWLYIYCSANNVSCAKLVRFIFW